MYELAIPMSTITVEQIAAAIKQMTPSDLDRLFDLVPTLENRRAIRSSIQKNKQMLENTNSSGNEVKAIESVASETDSTQSQAVEKVRSWVMETLDHKPLSTDEHFFDGLTLGEYLALSDEDEASLWDKWEGTPLYDMNEVEVMKNAISA